MTCLDVLCCPCYFVYGTVRSCPWFTLGGLLVSIVGSVVCIVQEKAVEEVMYQLALQQYVGFLDYFFVIFFLMLMVDALATLSAFLSSGKTREACFSQSGFCLVTCFQFLLGPLTQLLIVILLVVAFLVMLAIVIVTLPALLLLLLVYGACVGGAGAVGGLVHSVLGSGIARSITVESVLGVCNTPTKATKAFICLLLGSFVVMLAQIVLLVFAYANLVHVRKQMKQERLSRKVPRSAAHADGQVSNEVDELREQIAVLQEKLKQESYSQYGSIEP